MPPPHPGSIINGVESRPGQRLATSGAVCVRTPPASQSNQPNGARNGPGQITGHNYLPNCRKLFAGEGWGGVGAIETLVDLIRPSGGSGIAVVAKYTGEIFLRRATLQRSLCEKFINATH